MLHSKDGILRIPFVIARSNKKTREWFRGTMLYAHRNPAWFLRIFEIDGRSPQKRILDFGDQCPDGVIACGVPSRYIRMVLRSQGYLNVPIVAVPDTGRDGSDDPDLGTVALDVRSIAEKACELFAKRGCKNVAYVGAHVPIEVRPSRVLRQALADEAARCGMSFLSVGRKTSLGMGVQISDQPDLSAWLAALPKPCGILTWNDNIGRDVLDLCRAQDMNVPGEAYVLAIDDHGLVCENSFPTLSSIRVEYEQAAFRAAKLLEDLIYDREPETLHLTCGVGGVTERTSTQDTKSAGRIVAQACEIIETRACEDDSFDMHRVAEHLGISVRTLQLRFRESGFERTICQQIQHVRLQRVCWLLTHTSIPIDDITFAAGFRSLSRLKAVFSAKYGMNMREYRIMSKSSDSPPPPLKPDLSQ